MAVIFLSVSVRHFRVASQAESITAKMWLIQAQSCSMSTSPRETYVPGEVVTFVSDHFYNHTLEMFLCNYYFHYPHYRDAFHTISPFVPKHVFGEA